MDVQLIIYHDEKDITLNLIRQFWLIHNQYNQSIEEAYEDLKSWTKEGHCLYLIQYQKQFVGFVHLGNRGCQIDWLEDIFVLPEFQGKGIGTIAIQLVENIVKTYSESLYIEVAMKNEKALHLYHKIGYDCLNTITIRKDFNSDDYIKINQEKIHDMEFDIEKYK